MANAWQTPGLVGKWLANQFQPQLLSDCTVFKFGNFPESITPDELDEAFGALEDGPANSEVDRGEILQGNVYDLLDEGHYWQTRVLLSLKSCEYSDVCSGASRHQPDILLKLLN